MMLRLQRAAGEILDHEIGHHIGYRTDNNRANVSHTDKGIISRGRIVSPPAKRVIQSGKAERGNVAG